MGASTRARDWEVAGIAASEMVIGLGGGISYFYFRSREARFSDVFGLPRVGAGLTWGAGGVSLPGRDFDLPWTRIRCARPFSAEDLHGSAGGVRGGGISAIAGYDWVWISSRNIGSGLLNFGPTGCHGAVAGVHVGGGWTWGVWLGLTMSANAFGGIFNPNITI